MNESQLRKTVESCAQSVNDELGPGHRENAYHKAMIVALSDKGVALSTEATIPITYDGRPVARMHPDMVVGDDECLVLELKADYDGTEQLQRYLTYYDDDGVVGGQMISFGEDLEVVDL